MIKVLFFEQMGKFYELFEMDAHIGVKELDLQYMKVKFGLRAFNFYLVKLVDAFMFTQSLLLSIFGFFFFGFVSAAYHFETTLIIVMVL